MIKYYCDLCGSEIEVESITENVVLFFNVPESGLPPMSGLDLIKMKEVDVVRFPFTVCLNCIHDVPLVELLGKLAVEKISPAFRNEKFLEVRLLAINLKRKEPEVQVKKK